MSLDSRLLLGLIVDQIKPMIQSSILDMLSHQVILSFNSVCPCLVVYPVTGQHQDGQTSSMLKSKVAQKESVGYDRRCEKSLKKVDTAAEHAMNYIILCTKPHPLQEMCLSVLHASLIFTWIFHVTWMQ
jgi:hypothetical protein